MSDLGTLSIKLRPSSFDEVIGNKHVVEAVKNQLASSRKPIGWLFYGPSGCGKTTLADLVVRSLGAEEIIRLNGASLGAEEARDLADRCSFHPLSGNVRAVFIDEAQKITDAGQQVMLKLLEDCRTSVFLLAAMDASKIIKALRDRCLGFEVHGLVGAERRELIDRALVSARYGYPSQKAGIVPAIEKADITAPREILMACERFVAGMPPEEAVQNLYAEKPEYIEIARAVLAGDWRKTSDLLASVKPAETLGVRFVVVNCIKTMLLKYSVNTDRGEVLADCIKGLYSFGPGIQDGATHAATVAWLYKCCRRLVV